MAFPFNKGGLRGSLTLPGRPMEGGTTWMLPLLRRYEKRRPISWMVGAFAEIIRGSNGQIVTN
jgi:hypothetical protein